MHVHVVRAGPDVDVLVIGELWRLRSKNLTNGFPDGAFHNVVCSGCVTDDGH